MAAPMPLNGRRILIVESDVVDADMFANLLEDCGATVATAATVLAAIEAIRAAPPDAALLDVMINSGDTSDIAALLAVLHIGFIFYASHYFLDNLSQRFKAPVIIKPVRRRQILDALASVLPPLRVAA